MTGLGCPTPPPMGRTRLVNSEELDAARRPHGATLDACSYGL
ncbi:hypothetical protein ACU686_25580 [Yinghuangia aomiensis]